MTALKAFIKNYPVTVYFALTFAISWGGFILAVGPGGFSGGNWESDPKFPFAIAAMLAGPSVAGIALTGLISGSAGLRGLLSGLLRWRVALRWYAFALLPAPILASAVLYTVSISAPIFTTDDQVSVLLPAILAGLSTLFEELGWTGFAVPRLRLRYGVFTTGLIVGVLWGAWHLLQGLFISGTYAGGLSLLLFLPLHIFSGVAQLTAYRLLLVWLHDQTESLFVVTLMHASLTASTIFIFRPLATGVSFLTYGWILAATFWVVVATVAIIHRGRLS
jgi:membrane protease YdiL (CAAX protease family)